MKVTDCTVKYDLEGHCELCFTVDKQSMQECRETALKARKWAENGRLMELTVKPFRKRRSLDANAYLWVLLDKMAAKLKTDKEALYLKALRDYGVFTHLIVKPQAVERVCEEWRASVVLGDVEVNGKKGVQVQVYYGSSTYDTAEMARLIDGVVSDAKELGVETMTPEELSLLKEAWRN